MPELMQEDVQYDEGSSDIDAIPDDTSGADTSGIDDGRVDTDTSVDYDRIEEIVRTSVDSLGIEEVGKDVQALRADVRSLGEEQASQKDEASQVVTIDASQFATISDFIENDTSCVHLLNYYGLCACVLLALSIGLSLFGLLVGRK